MRILRPKPTRLASAVLATVVAACGPGGMEDGKNDSFGGANIKADGGYTDCQLAEVLKFVNESETGSSRLNRAGLSDNVSEAIVRHKKGPDGQLGTGDDDIYDDLGELDAVDYVGPVVLDFLVARILNRCKVDLETRPFINADTFAGSNAGGYNRDNVELEATMRVTGITGQQLHEILLDEDSRGRSTFSRIAKSRIMEAFTYSYGIDEMPWDSDSHQAREAMPYLPLTIESGRYIQDDDGGVRELDLGTDIMDDTYYDSFDYRLLRTGKVLRGRVRWDTADEVRRLLIAAKFGGTVDENGLKRAAKVDIRTSGGSHMDALDHDVRRGQVDWSGTGAPIEPIRQLYFKLKDEANLPDIGSHKDVLVLDPKVHLRSIRSRYHLDLAQLSAIHDFYQNGKTQMDLIEDMLNDAIASGSLSSFDAAAARDLIALMDLARDPDHIRREADKRESSILVANFKMPDAFSSTASDFDELDRSRATADVVTELYHQVGAALDDIDRAITKTGGLEHDEYVDMFIAWRRSVNSYLGAKRIHRPFLAEHSTIDGASDKAAQLDAFNAFGNEQNAAGDKDFKNFESVTDNVWNALGKHLEFKSMKDSQRMIEGAGTSALALWFDQAREFHVPDSSRPWGNFMIDTVDMTEMMTEEEWQGLSDAERKIDQAISPAKIFHTTLVNEVQIELGNEAPYVDRISELTGKTDDGSASSDDRQHLTGAQFVFDTMNDSLLFLSALKADKLLDRLEDKGAPSSISWDPSTESKGILALKLLADIL